MDVQDIWLEMPQCLEKNKNKKLGKMTFRDNRCGSILGIGKIGENPTSSIEYVYFIDGLKYNLLSFSQVYDKSNSMWFDYS